MSDRHDIREQVRQSGLQAGFDDVRFVTPMAGYPDPAQFQEFLDRGYHGDMGWMAETALRRSNPLKLWPDVRSIIMLAMNYGPAHNPMKALKARGNGTISVYAQGGDYHKLIKKRLKRVASQFVRQSGAQVKVFVDTAPVMEKPLAQLAGIGWQGKHTNLVSRKFGSWLFLGSIFTDYEFVPDQQEADHCGSCRQCLEICPTNAFPAPHQLDARRCISYLTIEHKGHIDKEFRSAMGNRIFGCDDCLAVCPWNKFASDAKEARLHPRALSKNPPLAELLALDEASFRARFAGSPVKRTGRDRFIRNVLIAAGNSADRALVDAIRPLLDDGSCLVRAMAVWALKQLCEPGDYASLKQTYQSFEPDRNVRREW